MAYMNGFKRGVCAGAYDSLMAKNEDFMAGYANGLDHTNSVYAAACQKYEAELNPLRS